MTNHYRLPEAAKLLGFSPATILTMVKEGSIAAIAIKRNKRTSYRIPAAEIDRLLKPLTEEPA